MKSQFGPIEPSRLEKLPEAGNAIIELVAFLPFFLIMLLGAIDFGRVMYTVITVSSAAHAGVQYGHQSNTKTGDFTGMTNSANQEAQNLAGTGGITVLSERFCRCPDLTVVNCVTGNCGSDGAPEIYVRVTATKSFTTLFKYPGIPSPVPLSRVAVFRAQ